VKFSSWDGLNSGSDKAMVDHLRFTQDLIRLRWNQPARRGDNVNPFHVHNQNRLIAFHRWLEGVGQDVVVAATLSETTWYNYYIGFPAAGFWKEVFNSDVYDNWVNPIVAGNGGGVWSAGARFFGVCQHRDSSERVCGLCAKLNLNPGAALYAVLKSSTTHQWSSFPSSIGK
jgi:1,4-alpha-glucan branching enzyme